MKIIDARGLECPKPVMKTKKATDDGFVQIKIHVDNEVAAANVTRFLQGQGFSAERHGAVPDITVEGKKITGGATTAQMIPTTAVEAAAKNGSLSVLLLSDKIGADSDGLGDALMKAFIGTLAQREQLPCVVALMNEGVKMALEERSTCDTLRELEQKGMSLLICGTCTKHFSITEEIKIGTISNMFEITDTVFGASKPVVIG